MYNNAKGCHKNQVWSLVLKIIGSSIPLERRIRFHVLTHSNFNNSGGCYTSDVSTTQPITKFLTKLKFDDKIAV